MMEVQHESEQIDNREAIVTWLRENSIPIATTNPDSLDSDLESIKDVIGKACIVGFGEATHGNKEFSQIKHRLLRFLVNNMGFTGLIMEVPEEPARRINDYIHTEDTDPRELLKNLDYWTTRTQEVLDLTNG